MIMENKKTILLIDDEVDLVDMIEFFLVSKGYIVVTAHDGLEGLERLKEIRPDLIILDINMPRMDGLEFFQKITGPDNRSLHPVLVLTARANAEEMVRTIGVDGFISKPFDIEHLIERVESIVRDGGPNRSKN